MSLMGNTWHLSTTGKDTSLYSRALSHGVTNVANSNSAAWKHNTVHNSEFTLFCLKDWVAHRGKIYIYILTADYHVFVKALFTSNETWENNRHFISKWI
jgi:hypothetical protein